MGPVEARRTLSVVGSIANALDETHRVLHSKIVLFGRVTLIANITGIILLLSVVLGSRRRRSKSALVKACLFASYTMSAYLITYAMSLMLHPDPSVGEGGYGIMWAMLLLIAFGSTDSFCAYSLVDNEQWRRYNWQSALKVWILLTLLFPYFYDIYRDPIGLLIILPFLVVILLKLSSKNQSLAASSRYALEKSSMALLDYLKMEHKAVDMRQVNPVTMKGYRYVVGGEELLETKGITQVVTLENVWNCEGELFSPDNGGNLIKDLCLSFSLFKILRLRYVGYKLPRDVNEKMVSLVRCGLLDHMDDNYHERVFRVVEDELAFLFDSFYTKFHLIFLPTRYRIRKAECYIIAVLSSTGILGLYQSVFRDSTTSFWEKLYLSSAMLCLMTFVVVELTQAYLLRYTRWAKVTNICKYVKSDSGCKKRCLEKHVKKICRLRSPQSWERKLQQYSLLDCYMYRPCKLLSNKLVSMFIKWDRDGQKKDHPIDLSREVKKAVLDRLKDTNDTRLENGLASMRRHNVTSLLEWACKLETQSEVIMVWHIATSLCEAKSELHSEESRMKFLVAMSLSKYLAYLVSFSPRLLPDHPYATEALFDQIIKDAKRLFSGYKTAQQKRDKLRDISRGSGHGGTTLERGAALGSTLLDEIGEPNLIWTILADFWVETMLYVAPSNNITAHVEELANGGEFVTHLWALMYHAGIKREKRSRWSGPDMTTAVGDTGPPVMSNEEQESQTCPSSLV
ncbi:hypothetical protein MLD38_020945 [Melastoma candidum]|uniref:Uncharacterized protein n=1 Tax=Melastoma candidum TaxID=119954 RepID=A0ACB9QFU2_9MYRT|nr:hypothetical protein MLD38_020945 [Melastoma candidum]